MLFQKSPCKLISVCTVSCIQCLHTLEKSMKSKAKDGNIFKIKLSSPFGLHSLVPLSFFFFFFLSWPLDLRPGGTFSLWLLGETCWHGGDLLLM